MYAVVHDYEKDAGRRGCHVGMPAVQEDSDMMVPVQENERFFVNDDEKGVNELAAVICVVVIWVGQKDCCVSYCFGTGSGWSYMVKWKETVTEYELNVASHAVIQGAVGTMTR